MALRKLSRTKFLISPLRYRFLSNQSSFYEVSGLQVTDGSVSGEIRDNVIDLKKTRPGDVINIPYELTISHSFKDFWHSAFYSQDRINTSTPFCRSLGLQDQVMPFSMMLFLTGSMSHAYDYAKIESGYKNAIYHWPAFAGDTFKKRFKIKSLRSTSDGRSSIFNIECELINQKEISIFTCDKAMIFPFAVPQSEVQLPPTITEKADSLLTHLISRSDILQNLGSQTLTSVKPGQLLLHTLSKPISQSYAMQLSTLARLNHERHFNIRKYRNEELIVPAGLVLGMTCSLASRDLHEVIHEELIECFYPNRLSPGEMVSAFTFVLKLDEHISGDIEAVTVRTYGVKNFDIKELKGKPLPIELFTTKPMDQRWPVSLEDILKKHCPELCKNVVCIADRKLYRPTPKQMPFLL